MTELSTVGRSLEHDAMEREGTKNLIELSGFVVSLQKQSLNHEERIAGLEDNMRINGVQEMNVKSKGNSAVLRVLGGVDANAYKNRKVRGRTYSAMWRRFKTHFGIPRYGELPAKDFVSAIAYLNSWEPDRELKDEIERANNQTELLTH